MSWRRGLALAATTGLLLVAGCGGDESREDADDVGNGKIDKQAPSVSAFNNKYSNVEHKCLFDRDENGNPRGRGTGLRVVVTTSKRMLVIPDPHCPGYLPEQAGTVATGGNAP